MSRFSDFADLILGEQRQSGTVVEVTSDTVRIATRRGAFTLRRSDATSYRKGDRVTIKGDQIVGRARGTPKEYVV